MRPARLLPLAVASLVATSAEAQIPAELPASARAAITARQRDEAGALDAPAPPTLPALAHRELTYTWEYTAARLEPNAIRGQVSRPAYAWFVHGALELPIVPRRWYVGAAHDVASAALPGIGSATLLGNPEIWGRGLWSSVLGLSSGGGFGVVLPIPRDPGAIEREVLRTVSVVRPWDVPYFDNLTLTFRPWFDIRHLAGPLVFQVRQGVDWSLGEGGTDLTARATFYVGYRATRAVGLGLELWEVYQVTAEDVADDERAAFAISPSVRFMLPNVQPALSALLPIATPLRGDVAGYYAVRISVGFELGEPLRDGP